MLSDREEFARDLRTVADRLEDGEYEVTDMELQKPAPKREESGWFRVEFLTIEEFERIARMYDDQRE